MTNYAYSSIINAPGHFSRRKKLRRYSMRGSKNPNPTRLETERRAAGMSRKKLAELSGVSSRVIERYEQGRTNINDASAAKVRDMANAIGCPIEKIMNE